MRLGLLGPAPDDQDLLADAAQQMSSDLAVDRVLYLGADRMLDVIVSRWAEELVGPSADDLSIMGRATDHCLRGSPEQIDDFLVRERKRSALRKFESLPGEKTRSVEIVGGKVAVMLHDKACLEEEDILPATLLIFGKRDAPLIKKVGRRWFLSPGAFPAHGMMVVDDGGDKLHATIYDQDLNEIESRILDTSKSLRMHARGEE